MERDTSILCTGDLHLGSHPSKIPESVANQRLSTRSVWQSVVDNAITDEVDAVLISGDIIDRENRYFEAFGAFEAGARQLNEAEIPTIVVTGNHDFDSLPRLVQDLDLDYLTLLGDDDDWERYTLMQDGDPCLHIDGWSFPAEHVFQSPLTDYDLDKPAEPCIGLLHGDFETRDSQYAPIGATELAGCPVDAWLLGHIHAPGIVHDADPLAFYPGSPQPLDPGEPGLHGTWSLRVQPNGQVQLDQEPGASLQYDSLEVDITDVDDVKSILPRMKQAIDDFVTREVNTTGLEVFLARVELTGRSALHGDLLHERATLIEQCQFQCGALPVRIERITLDTTPAIDLNELTDGTSPVAYLAELLLAIEDDAVEDDAIADAYPDLLDGATQAIHDVQTANPYTPLRQGNRLEDPEPDTAIAALEQEARALLDELLKQREKGKTA